jgi:REP element-mobilizing transposase RayT
MTRSRSSQLAFDLSAPPSWGGRRRGAGRKRGPNTGVPHATRTRFRRLPAHVTLRLRPDLPSLRTVAIVRELERSLAAGCARPGFRLAHYSLQGNHAHLIVEATDHDALGRGMKAIGARVARAVNRVAHRSGRVLADRYHLRLLPTPREVRGALRYVLLNARRHAAKAGAALSRGRVALDPASSARWFDGWKRRPPRSHDAHGALPPVRRKCPVARPRTWLLRVGWRRHGLLDPTDVPGDRPSERSRSS